MKNQEDQYDHGIDDEWKITLKRGGQDFDCLQQATDEDVGWQVVDSESAR